jgi:hypothetical protein
MQLGRIAIDSALEDCYPTQLDHRVGLQPGPGEEFPPLEEVVAFAVDAPVPHWHYISYGLTELGTKVSEDPSVSGWGFELTMRVAASVQGDPPVWPIQFMRWIAMTIWRDRSPLGAGHSFLLPDGMLEHYRPETEAVGFVVDEALGRRETVNGAMAFLQVVDLYADEYQLVSRWDALQVFEAIRAVAPRHAWLARDSVVRGPAGQVLLARADEQGSSQAVHYASRIACLDVGIGLDPLNRHVVANCLEYRVAYGREATIFSDDTKIVLRPGDYSVSRQENEATVWIAPNRAAALAGEMRQGRCFAPFVAIDGPPAPRGACAR